VSKELEMVCTHCWERFNESDSLGSILGEPLCQDCWEKHCSR
jgi:formylmethanofuran dehydrogenase subunit E